MSPTQALGKLYNLALFGPGFKGATFANIILRAERALANDSIESRAGIIQELAGFRDNLAQRQEILKQVHDALRQRTPE